MLFIHFSNSHFSMGNPRIPLQPDTYYHIYNVAVGNEKLFRNFHNYNLFLQKLKKYILPFNEILSYCLLPNHFHLLIKTNSETELMDAWNQKIKTKLNKYYRSNYFKIKSNESDDKIKIAINTIIDKLLIEQFSICFNSYVQSYNKCHNRMGSLLKESFQRKQINSEEYLRNLVFYIHYNPVRHGYVTKMNHWHYSSYKSIVTNKSEVIMPQTIIDIFGDLNSFLEYHFVSKAELC